MQTNYNFKLCSITCYSAVNVNMVTFVYKMAKRYQRWHSKGSRTTFNVVNQVTMPDGVTSVIWHSNNDVISLLCTSFKQTIVKYI